MLRRTTILANVRKDLTTNVKPCRWNVQIIAPNLKITKKVVVFEKKSDVLLKIDGITKRNA